MANIKTFNKIAYSFMAIFTRGRLTIRLSRLMTRKLGRKKEKICFH